MKKAIAFLILCWVLFSHKSASAQAWEGLAKQAKDYMAKGRYKQADSLFMQVLPMIEKEVGKKDTLYSNMMSWVAANTLSAGDLKRALAFAEEYRELTIVLYGKDHFEYASSSSSLAAVCRRLGQFDRAESLYFETLGFLERRYGKEHPDYGKTCGNIASVYESMGKYTKAEELYQTAISILEKKSGKEHADYAMGTLSLARVYASLGKLKKAEELYLEAKGIFERLLGKNHPTYAMSCNNLAEYYREIERYDLAIPLFAETKTIIEQVLGKNNPNYATCCNNLAAVYNYQGEYAKAEALLLEALEIRKRVLGQKSLEVASSCNNLGILYKTIGQYEKSLALQEEGLQIVKQILGENHPSYANSLGNLAGIYVIMQKSEQAEALYKEAMKIYEKNFGPVHLEIAINCSNLASVYIDRKEYDKAELLYLKAIDIWDKTIGREHYRYAACCNNRASMYEKMGKYDQAEAFFKESRAILARLLGPEHPDYASSCNNLAELYRHNGDFEKAEPLYKECYAIKNKQLVSLFPMFSEKERTAFLNSSRRYYENFLIFSIRYSAQKPEYAAVLMNHALFKKGIVFSSTQKMRSQIMGSGDSSLVNKFEQWNMQKEQYSKLINKPVAERGKSDEEMKTLASEINDLEKELSKRSTTFAKNTQLPQYTWENLKAHLGKNEAAVEVLRVIMKDSLNGPQYPVYVVTIICEKTQKQPVLLVLKNGEELESQKLNYYRTSLVLKKDDKSSYDAFWKPIADKLMELNPKGFSKIYFSPDGVYHQVSLNGLALPEKDKLFHDVFPLYVVGSTRDVIENSLAKAEPLSSITKTQEVHLYGYPIYDDENLQNEATDNKERSLSSIQDALGSNVVWSLLPGTKKEIDAIATLLKDKSVHCSVHQGLDASEESLKELRSPYILHVATHGFFLNKYQGKIETMRDAERSNVLNDPFYRCGLALAGCSDSKPNKEDGILTASEAMNLHLDYTDLVVLSACETGLGDVVAGEGVFGLQRAFQQAGAKTILMSLWKVNDEATQLLMAEFYKFLAKGKGKREAFVAAQNALRKKFPHPYYWAAFVLIGD